MLKCFIHYRLRKKGLPPEHENYINLTSIDEQAGELHYCTPAVISPSGVDEAYTKAFKASAPERTSFSDTVHDNEEVLKAKANAQILKNSRTKKEKNAKQSSQNKQDESKS